MAIVGEDLLRTFYRLFYLPLCDSSDQSRIKINKKKKKQKKKQCSKSFDIKIILTIIPTYFVINSLFVPSY